MDKSPLNYTKEDLENILNKQVVIEIGSRENNTIIETYRCEIIDFSVDATKERNPIFITLIKENGERKEENIMKIKEIKILNNISNENESGDGFLAL